MLNVRLAGGYLYGKQLVTWLSLVVSLMASFLLSFFPLDVLDEIWDVIESCSEGFLTYSYRPIIFCLLFITLLKKGDTIAYFHCFGKRPILIDLLNSTVNVSLTI